MLTALAVATRIIANPVSNAFQKRLTGAPADPVFIIAAVHGMLTIALLPLLPAMRLLALPPAFWFNMTVSAVLAVAGNALLVYALRSGELSVLGSINAYKAVLSLLLAVVLIGEVPNAAGMIGVLLILAGSYFVVDRTAGQSRPSALVQFFRAPGVRLRFAALVCSASEAVFLKRALLDAAPLATFGVWSALGWLVSLLAVAALVKRRVISELVAFETHWRAYLSLAAATGVMQLATLATFDVMPVGYSLALFQLSTVISVVLGYRYFQERRIARRLFGSGVMIAGAVMIAILGRTR